MCTPVHHMCTYYTYHEDDEGDGGGDQDVPVRRQPQPQLMHPVSPKQEVT